MKAFLIVGALAACQLMAATPSWAEQDYWEIWLQPDNRNSSTCVPLSMAVSRQHSLMFAGERLVLKSAGGINVVMTASEARVYRSVVAIETSNVEVTVDMSRLTVLVKERAQGCQWATPSPDRAPQARAARL